MTVSWKGGFLYRYREWNEYTKKILLEEELFYASFCSLNDPNEGKNFSDELIELHLKKIIGENNIDHKTRCNILNDLDGYNENNKSVFNKYRDAVLGVVDKMGVVCLTEKYDNNPMWHFYANESKGVCLEFYIPDIKDEKYVHLLPHYVTYEDGCYNDEIADNAIFKKNSDWSYEKEWRMLVRNINTKNDRVKKYPRDKMLVSIIVGHNMSEKDFKELKDIIDEINLKRTEKIDIHKRINSSYGVVFEDQDKWNNRKNGFQKIINKNSLD
ncbi:DUF2971 domain-containing protein [Acinetobacter sp. MB5]|uniref:DUF2971 domain-containing protein n=1 Tax=Acinetobacter sp. MB5 TaxID=2069438 RepID=UPI000DD0ACB2|nr:DUF2971 domain-containing protein [Acinetobacter sp. MB5]